MTEQDPKPEASDAHDPGQTGPDPTPVDELAENLQQQEAGQQDEQSGQPDPADQAEPPDRRDGEDQVEQMPELSQGSFTTFRAEAPEVVDVNEPDEPDRPENVPYEPPPDGEQEDLACLDDMSLLSQGSFADPIDAAEAEHTPQPAGDAPVDAQNNDPAGGEEPTLIERMLAEKDTRSRNTNTRPPSFQPGAKKDPAAETLGPVEPEPSAPQDAQPEPESEEPVAAESQDSEAEGQVRPGPGDEPSGMIIQPPSDTAKAQAESQASQPEDPREAQAEQARPEEAGCETPARRKGEQPEPAVQDTQDPGQADPPPAEQQDPGQGVAQDPVPDVQSAEGPLAYSLPEVDSSGQVQQPAETPEAQDTAPQDPQEEPEPAGQAEPPQADADQAEPAEQPAASQPHAEQDQAQAAQSETQWTPVAKPEPDTRPFHKKHLRLLAGVAALLVAIFALPAVIDLPDFSSADEGQGDPRIQQMQDAQAQARKMQQLANQRQQQMLADVQAAEQGVPETRQVQPAPAPYGSDSSNLPMPARQPVRPDPPAESPLAQDPPAQASPPVRPARPARPSVPEMLRQIKLSDIQAGPVAGENSATINGQVLRLGQTSREGIRLLKVSDASVIIRYEGQLFRLRWKPKQ